MGFLDELKKLTKPYSDEEDDYSDYDDEELDEPAPAPQPAAAPRASRRSAANAETAESPAPFTPMNNGTNPAAESRRGGSRVLNLHNSGNLQVVLVKPERYENVSEVADHLRDKHAVLLNLESTDKNIARRLVDFLSGCAYALDGKIKKVAASAYLITPFNVDIVGDLVEELENNGMYF